MKYQVNLTNPAHAIKPETFKDSGEARHFFNNQRDNAFLVAASLISISPTGQQITLERFTRH